MAKKLQRAGSLLAIRGKEYPHPYTGCSQC